jgi:diacylglycerol kinase
MLSIKRFLNSFVDAWRGLCYVFRHEQNFKIQLLATFIILAISIYFPLRKWEMVLLIIMCVMVVTMELLNTALEHFMDLFKPRIHPYVGVIKDIMAAAVLVTSLGALVVGWLVLSPHFLSLAK